jgi:uncharacterized membrane protein
MRSLTIHFFVALSFCAWGSAQAQETNYDLTDLSTFDGRIRVPTDVNDHGVVVGNAFTEGRQLAFRWTRTDGLTLLPTRDVDDLVNAASAVNNEGHIVGSITVGEIPLLSTRPALWRPSGTGYELVELDSEDGEAMAINDDGVIAGYVMGPFASSRAVLWREDADEPGTFQRIELGWSDGGAQAHGLNNTGAVVGSGTIGSGTFRAFRWTETGGRRITAIEVPAHILHRRDGAAGRPRGALGRQIAFESAPKSGTLVENGRRRERDRQRKRLDPEAPSPAAW